MRIVSKLTLALALAAFGAAAGPAHATTVTPAGSYHATSNDVTITLNNGMTITCSSGLEANLNEDGTGAVEALWFDQCTQDWTGNSCWVQRRSSATRPVVVDFATPRSIWTTSSSTDDLDMQCFNGHWWCQARMDTFPGTIGNTEADGTIRIENGELTGRYPCTSLRGTLNGSWTIDTPATYTITP
jgi:hypothetical protein